MKTWSKYFWRIAMLPMLAGCASGATELDTVDYVNLERFMGEWYVIASIPTFLEKEAYNAIEEYELNDDGTIATTFTFRKGGFDGKRKKYEPKGWVTDTDTNAVWGMQFIWPIKADYRIVYLTPDYSQTVIARNKRDYVWIMARTPGISDEDYQKLTEFVAGIGYDTSKLRKVPHQ
jgi:apolipoprotein D and lipocalin family protein